MTPLETIISTGGNQIVVVPVVYREVEVTGSAVCQRVIILGSGRATMTWMKIKNERIEIIIY